MRYSATIPSMTRAHVLHPKAVVRQIASSDGQDTSQIVLRVLGPMYSKNGNARKGFDSDVWKEAWCDSHTHPFDRE